MHYTGGNSFFFVVFYFTQIELLPCLKAEAIRPEEGESKYWCKELFIHRKAMVKYVRLSTNSGFENFITVQILFSLHKKPILQLVDNCTYGTIAFPCIKSYLADAMSEKLLPQIHGCRVIFCCQKLSFAQW